MNDPDVYGLMYPWLSHDPWRAALAQYLVLLALLYLGTAITIRLLGKRMQASLTMSASPAVRSKFQPYMEGLRGLLAINIFVVHCAEQYNYARTGIFWPGLDFHRQVGGSAVIIFFFLTGYLIWKGMLDNPDFSPKRFLRGRFYRTWPAYAVTMVVIFCLGLARGGFHLRVPLWKFVASFLLWLPFGLPFQTSINGYSDVLRLGAGVMWTLQVDWIFYLMFLFMVWFGRKSWRTVMLIAIAAILYQPFLHYQGHLTGIRQILQLFLGFFCDCMGIGILLATFKPRWPEWPWARTRAASAVAMFWLASVFCFFTPRWGLRESVLLLPTYILLLYGNDFFGLLNTRPALLLGRISYSVYLLHAIVLIVFLHLTRPYLNIANLTGWQFWMMMAPIGMVTLWLAMLSHRFIEVPVSTLGKRRASAAPIPRPEDATAAQVKAAIQEEAAQLPGSAEAELDSTVSRR